MSKANTFENEILEHVLNNTTVPLIGDATGLLGSTTNGSLYVSLHTADPTEAGTQTSNEATYNSYARVAVARNPSSKQWTVTNNVASNAAAITFPTSTGGTNTITYLGVGTAPSSTGKLLYIGQLSLQKEITSGDTPEIAIGGVTITED